LTDRTPLDTKASLITAIEAGFRDIHTHIPAAQMKKACARFRSRLEQVLAAKGGYFK
jgi:hypothetical protein